MSNRADSIGSKSSIPACSNALFAGIILSLTMPALAATPANSAANVSVKVESPGAALVAGSSTQFVVRVGNQGGASIGENRLIVALPEGLQNMTWSCSASSGSHCASASGSGAMNESLQDLAPNSNLDFVFRAEVSAAAPPYIDVVARATLAESARCASAESAPCQSRLSLGTGPGVMLDVRSQNTALVAGQQFRYTIAANTVSTHSNTEGTVLRSPVPSGLINSSWRCHSNVGACIQASGQGAINQVLGNFSQGSVSFEVTATVAANAPANIVQAAVAVPPYGGSCAAAENGSMRFHSSPCTARNVLATLPSIVVSRSEDYLADASTIATRFVLDNNGSAADGSVVDAVPASGVSRLDWTCVGQGAICPQASGSGAIHQTIASWPASGRLIYDLVSQVASSANSEAKNSLAVTPSGRGICAASGRTGSCEAVYSVATVRAGLTLSERVDELGSRGGGEVTYRINIGNSSSAASAQNVVLHVPLPKGIVAFASWTCEASNASSTSCPQTSGSGAIREMFAQLAPSSDLNYTIHARVAGHPPATITSRATLSAPASAGLGCGATDAGSHACVASSQFSTVPVLALDQSMLASTLEPGSMVEYFLDVFNLGAAADLVQVRNFLPSGISNASWDCSGLGMGCPVASGNGEVKTSLVQMPSGSGVRIHVSGQVDTSQPESASSVLTAMPSSAGRCHDDASGSLVSAPCVDRLSSSYAPKLQVTQAADELQLLRGGVMHHMLTLKNLGGPALDTRLVLPLAAGIERSSWTCAGLGGAVCPQTSGSGAIDAHIASLPFDAYLRYSIRSNLAIDAPASISSVATTTPGAGTQCADAGCASSLSLPVTDVPSAHLQVKVVASATIAHPGASATWDVDVRNLGVERAGRFSLANGLASAGVTINSWTCSGAECPATEGNGPIDSVIESLSVYDPAGSEESIAAGRLHFVVSGTISQHPDNGAEMTIGVGPSSGDTCAPVSCVASSVLPSALQGLSVVTLDVSSFYSEVYPDSSVTYKYTISNSSGADISGTPVYTMDPLGIVSSTWTCASVGSATCPTAGSGSGPINQVIPFLAIGSSVVFTIDAITDTTIPDELEFVVGANPGSGVFCDPASCMTSLFLPNGQEELDLSLDADVGVVEPFSTITYTFVVANAGPGDATAIVVKGTDSADFTSSSWTCTSTSQSGCNPSGVGELDDYINSLDAGESATYMITAAVGATLPPSIDYQVSVFPEPDRPSAPQGSFNFNCVPASCDVSLSLPTGSPTVQLSLTSMGQPPNLIFLYTVSNPGPADVFGVDVYGVDSPAFVGSSWTCSGIGTTCTPSGTGELQDFIAFLPANTSVTYTVTPVFGSPLPPSADYTAGVSQPGGETTGAAPQGFTQFICIPAECFVSISVPIDAQDSATLNISKISDRARLTPGGSVRYTIDFANVGSVDATSVQFFDAIPNGLDSFNWTCSSSGDVSCEQSAGTGSLSANFDVLPAGASLTYVVDATVSLTATGDVVNRAQLTGDDIQCNPSGCQAVSRLPVAASADILVSKSALPAAGSTVSPGEPILWTLSVLNSGGPTTAVLSLRDVLPTSVSAISVTPASGVVCDDLSPDPGSTLTCTIGVGFSGQASVLISATIAAGASGAVVNSVSATGIGDIVCDNCSVSNPVGQAVDLALVNPRPFNAGGIAGTLIDLVNLSPTPSSMSQLSVSPVSSLRLLSPFASNCTTSTDDQGNISVTCPSPPETQGIHCSGATCSVGQLSRGGALTVFVALNGSATAILQLSAPGDTDNSNNSIELPVGGTP